MDVKKQCAEIYINAFGEDGSFSKKLFDICFENCRFVLEENRVASMCFLLPCRLVNIKESCNAFYVFAVATREELRGKGYMTKLFNEIKQNESLPLILRPANEGLVELYKKIGFLKGRAKANAKRDVFLEPLGTFATLVKDNAEYEEKPFTVMYYGVNPQEFKELYFPFSMF